MHLSLAFSHTAAGRFLMAALVLAALKLISGFIQFLLSRGDFRQLPQTRLFQVVYFTGKVTPALAAACACVAAILQRDQTNAWLFGLFAVFIAAVALYVVRLRKQGRFFGVAEAISKKRS